MFAILVHKEQYFTQLKMKRHLVLGSARCAQNTTITRQ